MNKRLAKKVYNRSGWVQWKMINPSVVPHRLDSIEAATKRLEKISTFKFGGPKFKR